MSVNENPSFLDLGIIPLLNDLCSNFGWNRPTIVQINAIPLALEGKDIIAIAETGSGKTGAFLLPIIQQWFHCNKPNCYALILAPTRELVQQLAFEAIRLGNFSISSECTPLQVAVLVGGEDMVDQALKLAWRKHHFIFATPGRLIDHLKQSSEFASQQLFQIKHLVLDEADRMLNMAFADDIDILLNLFEKPPVSPSKKRRRRKLLQKNLDSIPNNCDTRFKTSKSLFPHPQTHLYSATMTKDVKKLRRAALRSDAIFVACTTNVNNQPLSLASANNHITIKTGFPIGLQHYCLPLRLADRPAIMDWIIDEVIQNDLKNLLSYQLPNCNFGSNRRIIVFCKRCLETNFVTQFLIERGYLAVGLTGRTKQSERKQALDEFIHGKVNILVATDVASRGLDIPCVQLVINYNVPFSDKTYRHRVGRTARAGLPGVAVTLVTRDTAQSFLELETSLSPYLRGTTSHSDSTNPQIIPRWPLPLPNLYGNRGLMVRRRTADEAWSRACKMIHKLQNNQNGSSKDDLSDLESLDEYSLLSNDCDSSQSDDDNKGSGAGDHCTISTTNFPTGFKLNTSGSAGIRVAEAVLKSFSKSKLARNKERDHAKEVDRHSKTIGWGLDLDSNNHLGIIHNKSDDDDDEALYHQQDMHIDLPLKIKYDKIKSSRQKGHKRLSNRSTM